MKGEIVSPLPPYYNKISIAVNTVVVPTYGYANIVPKGLKNMNHKKLIWISISFVSNQLRGYRDVATA